MGQSNGCLSSAGSVDKLLKKYKPELVNFIAGSQGKSHASGIFEGIKQQIATKFNQLPFSSENESKFSEIIERVNRDEQGQLINLDNMKNSLNQVKGIDTLDQGKKNQLLDLAGKQFHPEISDKIEQIRNSITSKFNASKYLPF